MATAVKASNGQMVRVTADRRVQVTAADEECAEILIRVAIAMGLKPRKIRRVLDAADRSIRSLYRDYERLKGRPLDPTLLDGEDE